MATIIEDRECTCGHFYGNHPEKGAPGAGLAAGLGGTVAVSRPCSREGCGCEDYTPGDPLDGDTKGGGPVSGYCPMGCGPTLHTVLDPWLGAVVACSSPACPRPSACSEILADAETEHVVEFGERTFTVRHPLRERIDNALMTCQVHNHIERLDGPPVEPGLYRALPAKSGGWTWEPVTEITDGEVS